MSETQIRVGTKLTTKSGKTVEVTSLHIWVNKDRLTDCMIGMKVDGKPKMGDAKNLNHILENY